MAAKPTHHEILRPYLSDLVALEKTIFEAAEKQRADERVQADPRTAHLVERIYNTTGTRLRTLEEHAAALGGETAAAIKGAVASVAGTVAGVYDLLRKHPVSRMLRDDYTALSLSAIGHSMLHTTGLTIRDLPIGNIGLRHLREIAPLIMELSDVIPSVVVRELVADDPDLDPSVAEIARVNVARAWMNSAEQTSVAS
jgi:hypothetical protein